MNPTGSHEPDGASGREAIVFLEHFSLPKVIGQALRVQADDSVQEPLPERWVELIRHLNARERDARAQEDDASRKRSLSSDRLPGR
jgi:hypothetical protein